MKGGSFHAEIATALRKKREGNELLNAGDYEDALRAYEAGLAAVTFHERALAMVQLPP